jgi:hypothetical protein
MYPASRERAKSHFVIEGFEIKESIIKGLEETGGFDKNGVSPRGSL